MTINSTTGIRHSLRHGILIITSLAVMAPLLWMLILSAKPTSEIFAGNWWILTSNLQIIENYTIALTENGMPRYLLNGVIVSAGILTGQLIFALPAAYALAKMKLIGKNTIFIIVLFCLMVPHQVIALPLFIMINEVGLLNTYWALILPFIISPFGVFLFRQFMISIPDEIIDAARLDGYEESEILIGIVIPLCIPAIIAFGIFSIVSHWNELFWPSIVIKSNELMPPALGVVAFRNEDVGTDYGPLMAGAVIVVAPLVLCFALAQKWFIDGLTSTSSN